MPDYCSIDNAKFVLQIDLGDTAFDEKLALAVTSGSSLVDGFLRVQGLSVPSEVPELVKQAAAYFAAWQFKHSSDPKSDDFWSDAQRFLNSYIDAVSEAYVGSA
jgi:hypothetical protein